MLAKPTSDLTMRFIADYSHRNEHCCIAEVVRDGAPLNLPNCGTALAVGQSAGQRRPRFRRPWHRRQWSNNVYDRNAYANRPDLQDITDGGVSLQVDYKMPEHECDADLHHLLAQLEGDVGGFDADFSTADLVYLPTDDTNSSEFRDISQEVRFAGAYQ